MTEEQRLELVKIYLSTFSNNSQTFPSHERIQNDLEMLNKFIENGNNQTTTSNK